MEERYQNREIDSKLKNISDKVENYHVETMTELKKHQATHTDLLEQVKFTNGKVKKIIIALVAIGAFALGTGLANVEALIKLIV